jgi:hypothetical protein
VWEQLRQSLFSFKVLGYSDVEPGMRLDNLPILELDLPGFGLSHHLLWYCLGLCHVLPEMNFSSFG